MSYTTPATINPIISILPSHAIIQGFLFPAEEGESSRARGEGGIFTPTALIPVLAVEQHLWVPGSKLA